MISSGGSGYGGGRGGGGHRGDRGGGGRRGRRGGGRGGGGRGGWQGPKDDRISAEAAGLRIKDKNVLTSFLSFQTELDEKHDRMERLKKLSQDVTIESKRIIFQLHRITTLSKGDPQTNLLDEAWARLEDLRTTKFLYIAEELKGHDPYQYLYRYSAGVQEYIEALSFFYFLREDRLVTYEEVQVGLVFLPRVPSGSADTSVNDVDIEKVDLDESGISTTESDSTEKYIKVTVPLTEYLLGIGDIAGEVMRYAINSISAGDFDTPAHVCNFLGKIAQEYSGLQSQLRYMRDFGQKLTVLRQSLQKVEQALYVLELRKSELPKEMLADAASCWAPDSGPDNHYEIYAD